MRGDSYRLLLQSSVAGAILLMASLLLVYLFGDTLRQVDIWWHRVVPLEHSGVTFLSFFLGLLLGPLANIGFSKHRAAERAAKEKGDPLELLLRSAVSSYRPVLITVRNGKVYYGLVTFSSSPAVSVESVTILPRMSGYRRPKSRTVRFTTDYQPVLNAILTSDRRAVGLNPNDLAVVLPVREIESACFFEKRIHDRFFADSPPLMRVVKRRRS